MVGKPTPPSYSPTNKFTVWQIAQRDYKFGKGKHLSLTKATYDAVANRFRALWGKEAGWAHSVLFTADLKTFSEKLVTKIETGKVEVAIKKEVDAMTTVNTTLDTEITTKRVKRELDDGEHQVLEIKEKKSKITKRRKKT
jgi:N-glycosylase/DNA lyase